MPQKFKQVWEAPGGGFSKWAAFGNEKAGARKFTQLSACCHCGLVHEIELRVKNGVIEERVRQSVKETNAQRTAIGRAVMKLRGLTK